jgi:hypothetical protein
MIHELGTSKPEMGMQQRALWKERRSKAEIIFDWLTITQFLCLVYLIESP